jgi:hypothetical protein
MKPSTFTGPSGKIFELREQNGEDDDLLSKMGLNNGKEIIIINQFLAGVILSIDGAKPVTPEMVKHLLLRDKYAAFIHSRIFSLGDKLRFEYSFDSTKPPAEYEEDLTQYIWDYSKEFPANDSELYNPQRIRPYNNQEGLIEVITDHNTYRLDYIDGNGEDYLFKLEVHVINAELTARNLKVKTQEDKFELVKNYKEISSRELAYIRKAVKELDPVPQVNISIEHPTTGEAIEMPLLAIRDFSFPTLL